MKDNPPSLLNKATFALLVLILGCVVYLIARDRARDRELADARAREAAEEVAENPRVWDHALPRSSFAPLRPRAGDSNTTRRVTAGTTPVMTRGASNPTAEPPPATPSGTEADAPVRSDATLFAGQLTPTLGGVTRVRPSRSISGRAVLRGTPPPEKTVTLDAVCARLQPNGLTTRHFVVSSDGGLANVFVYIKSGAPSQQPPRAKGPTLDQIGCEFQPYVMGVQAGQTFEVRNSDPVLENLHPLPKVSGNRERNVAQPPGKVTTFVFEKPELFIQFKTEVHPWMFGYVCVTDHPWFAITDQDGNFSLPTGLPAGQYTLAAKHLKAGELTQRIIVSEDGGASPVEFTFAVPKTVAAR
jgi:hypothetical protein